MRKKSGLVMNDVKLNFSNHSPSFKGQVIESVFCLSISVCFLRGSRAGGFQGLMCPWLTQRGLGSGEEAPPTAAASGSHQNLAAFLLHEDISTNMCTRESVVHML